MENDFGKHVVIDFAGGDGYKTFEDKGNIHDFIINLCNEIKMERYGKPQIEWFGNDNVEGFSFVQLITTSLVSGHFCGDYEKFPHTSSSGYIDVFSCKDFSENTVKEIIKKHFNPDRIFIRTLIRSKPVSMRHPYVEDSSI